MGLLKNNKSQFSLKKWVFISYVLFLWSSIAFAAEYRVKLLMDEDPSKLGSHNIQWDASQYTQGMLVQMEPQDNSLRDASLQPTYFVILNGRLLTKNLKLVYNAKKVKVQNDGEFSVKVEIDSDSQDLTIFLVNFSGNVETQTAHILFPEWSSFLEEHGQGNRIKIVFSPGLGFTWVNYQQASQFLTQPTLSELAVTLKASAEYPFKKLWSLGGDIFFTPLPLSTSISGTQIQFLGANLGLGYDIPNIMPETWSLKVMGGYYYRTTFTSSITFGYVNLQGPQLYPQITKTLSKGKKAWLYFKYSPILSGLTFLSLSSAEIATGGGYLFSPFQNGKTMSITLDLSILNLQFYGGSGQVRSYTLSGNIYF